MLVLYAFLSQVVAAMLAQATGTEAALWAGAAAALTALRALYLPSPSAPEKEE